MWFSSQILKPKSQIALLLVSCVGHGILLSFFLCRIGMMTVSLSWDSCQEYAS